MKITLFPFSFLLAASMFLPLTLPISASAGSFTDKDRALLLRLDERINQMDKRFQELREDMNKRFQELRQDTNKRFQEFREDMNKRFEQVDKRFEQVDKRFEQVDKQFENLTQLLIAIIAAFTAIVAVTIGFAIWDRRTMIRPFEDRVQKITADIARDHKNLTALIKALRTYAKKDQGLAQILKTFSLL